MAVMRIPVVVVVVIIVGIVIVEIIIAVVVVAIYFIIFLVAGIGVTTSGQGSRWMNIVVALRLKSNLIKSG